MSLVSGPTQLVRVPADSSYDIQPGMLVGLYSGELRPPSSVTFAGSVENTQGLFAESFLGVAHSASPVGDSGMVSVNVSPLAVYALPLEAGGCGFGEPVAPAANDAGNGLRDDMIAPVSGRDLAVGLAMEAAAVDASAVRAAFASAYSPAANHTLALGPA